MNEIIAIGELPEIYGSAKEDIARLTNACSNFVIINLDALKDAKELAKQAKSVATKIESIRADFTKPLLEKQRAIKAYADNLTSELNAAVSGLRKQITDFELEQERIRQAELARFEEERRQKEEEARKQAELLRQKLAAEEDVRPEELEAIKAQISDIEEMKHEAAEIAQPISSNIRKVWDFEIIDENAIPRQFLVVDIGTIRKAIMAGVREIPGVKIFQKPQLNLR